MGLVAFMAARGAWGMYTKFAAASEADAAAKLELETLSPNIFVKVFRALFVW